jgi:hypothetical protein
MVETMDDPSVGAVGSRLLYPRDAMGSGRWTHPPLSLQHGGVSFRLADGVPMPVPAGAGGDPRSPWAAGVREAPALTAACLLLRRVDFDGSGGLDEAYVYGMEDIDLCLALRGLGRRLVYDGRAVLWHHESATRGAEDRAVRMERIAANRARFAARWAPRLYRTVLNAAINGDAEWLADPITIRIVAPERAPDVAGLVASAAQALGWQVVAGDEPSLFEVLADPGDERSRPDDAVLRIAIDAAISPGGDPAERLRSAALAAVGKLRIGVLIDDDHPRDDLATALGGAGWSVRVRGRSSWTSPAGAVDDVAVHVGSLPDAPVRPGQVLIGWGVPDGSRVPYDDIVPDDASGTRELVSAIERLTSARPMTVG